jgi:hypothetical protein
MNRKLFGALVLMALALAINATAQNKAQANIPFSFIVGSKVLPAASYDVSQVGMTAIAIRPSQGGEGIMALYNSAGHKQLATAKLVFHKYGDRYFLSQVWDSSGAGMQLRESKLEKEQELAAKNGSAPQEVLVALR